MLLAPAAVKGVFTSLILCWVILCLACENWILACLAMFTITMITIVVFGFLFFSGWGLGLLEGILVVLVIGFSVDYTVHLSEYYHACTAPTRLEKVQFALGGCGVSIMSGAISTCDARTDPSRPDPNRSEPQPLTNLPPRAGTMGAAGIMLTANIAFFKKFGTFIFLTTSLSTVFSLVFYASLLLVIGPLGSQGRLVNLYAGLLKSASEHMKHEMEAAEEKEE